MNAIKLHGGFDFLKQELNKPLFLIIIAPYIGGYFPEHINVDIDVIVILFDFISNSQHLAGIKMIIAHHNQNEVFQYPHLTLVLDLL